VEFLCFVYSIVALYGCYPRIHLNLCVIVSQTNFCLWRGLVSYLIVVMQVATLEMQVSQAGAFAIKQDEKVILTNMCCNLYLLKQT